MNIRSLRSFPPKTLALIIGNIVLLLIGGGMLVKNFMHSEPTPLPAQAEVSGAFRPTTKQLEALKITPVATMNFRSEQITEGTIANNDDAMTPVFSPYSGQVAKLYAKLGDVVQKGAPLMSVEASEFVQAQNDLVTAVATLNTAQSQVKLTEASEKRQRDLYQDKAGAQKDWLQSQADRTTAQNNLRSAEIALGAVRNRLHILGKSDQEISRIEIEPNIKKMHAEAVVRSPIAGTVILRQVGLGQYIQSVSSGAANPVYSIGNLSTVWLIANVRETETPQMTIGHPVEVQVPAWPKRVFKAKITWVAPSIDPNTHRLQVRAEIDNRDGALKPMMFASFRILTGSAVNAPGVPQSAVVYEGADAHVFVARDDGTLAIRQIQTGRVSGDMVEVTDGLVAGDKIVTSGALFIDRATENKS